MRRELRDVKLVNVQPVDDNRRLGWVLLASLEAARGALRCWLDARTPESDVADVAHSPGRALQSALYRKACETTCLPWLVDP